MPVRALRPKWGAPVVLRYPSESINARKGIKTEVDLLLKKNYDLSESINARKGIKTLLHSGG